MKHEDLQWRFRDVEPVAGVVQNPQPVVFSKAMDVDSQTTSRLEELVTEMGAPENMKLYTIMCHVLAEGTQVTVNDTINNDGANVFEGIDVWVSGHIDLDLSIFKGNNRVPHRAINVTTITENNSKEMVLSSPIYVQWSERLYIQVQNNDPQANDVVGTAADDPGSMTRVIVQLIGEIVDEVDIRRRLERQSGQKQAQKPAQEQ